MKLSLKTCLFILPCLLIIVAVAAAESMYVSEDFEITLRTGPGTDRKIIAMVPSGRLVEIVEKGAEWSTVRLPSGKEGWVLTRYLTAQPPSAIRLERLETKHADVLNQNKDLQQKVNELTSENRNLNNLLKQSQDSLAKVETTYDALKNDSADFIKFKAEYEKNRKELQENREKAEKAENQLNRIANSQLYEGMLYGGGLIIFGFVAGFIMKRPKRRSPLM